MCSFQIKNIFEDRAKDTRISPKIEVQKGSDFPKSMQG